ncbi:MAG: GGDEF domain-containing protein [Acidobacteriota bacterium]|nr:GGDEF domain-containing protein [Blastocatellia bacterium]MDW8411800.1 GGDEF domain-containing protein [Acidobacteriota bacterium]
MVERKSDSEASEQTVEIHAEDIQNVLTETWATKYSYTLTVIEGENFGYVYTLQKQETVLGRSEAADFRIFDPKASRRHLMIRLQQDGQNIKATAIDLESKNGTYVNGERIADAVLKNSDKIQIGDTILKFEVKDLLDLNYHEKLYQQATRDVLTGLWNRSYLNNELDKLISVSNRYRRVFSVVILDIDHFKSINDTYGHDIGDIVLKVTAGIVMSQLRSHDTAARFGGEEFVLLMPETPLEGAQIAAERIRLSVASYDFTNLGYPKQVTVSLGIAQYPLCGSTADELIKRADEALYRAKRSGRNRSCTASPL